MIKIFYKCKCMQDQAALDVPERPIGGAIEVWMAVVQQAISIDHNNRNPQCRATTLEYAKIPLDDNAPQLGTRAKLN